MLSLLHHLMLVSGPVSLTPRLMTSFLRKLQKEFRNEKVRDGVLVDGPPGQHPCANPSERRPGWDRFKKLLADWKAWKKCSKKIAAVLSTGGKVELALLLSELEDAGLTAYSGKKTQYASVRFVRMLIHCSGCSFADTEADWEILRKMSKHVSEVVSGFGIQRYEDALAMRDAMRKATKRTRCGYALSDLIIYMCLIKLKKDK